MPATCLANNHSIGMCSYFVLFVDTTIPQLGHPCFFQVLGVFWPGVFCFRMALPLMCAITLWCASDCMILCSADNKLSE